MGAAVGVVLAAGLGTRVGADGNKAYLPLSGRSMLTWSLDTLAKLTDVARTVLVFRIGEFELARDTVTRELPCASVELVEGGDTRHASEFNVLQYLATDIETGTIDVVAIHDAARPLAGPEMFRTAIAAAREFGGALPALPIAGLARVDRTGLESVADLGPLVRVQTPQAFRARDLLHAYRSAEHDGFEGTDTASCIERYTDVQIHTFAGRSDNLKVTYARDVAVAQRLLTDRSDPAGSR
ncbi:2-C-methyl-D-erythritol 4-phosphate cytidylyltransferase [Mycolicibacterium cyprinidarum]|uniref:2-C-methyl-D-erythritol 4-phosphate cytidylyltransferase n=1 Tax=Mycolicibacterium cyprinidarum TaxID=2860311 RepID=A0ABQ4VCH6_9MYCO|nr:2-C-methyl-D-erythritol 4-phosphate cytidylyltransferase [Mycolicibacterium sp. NGTWS1803]GJF10566.1 2-C-methyl-D-erythritol 4-phosphate cytidylyltransferase [Mycolicibacterium sp. NGTWS0302]GJF17974.1 2-C-methyl-D-erythritol 4-phosphate cytidylyltransferase [Mycolicibacterium sp. NGTWSNA01]